MRDDPMSKYLRFVRIVIMDAVVAVRGDGTILFALGGYVHEWSVSRETGGR